MLIFNYLLHVQLHISCNWWLQAQQQTRFPDLWHYSVLLIRRCPNKSDWHPSAPFLSLHPTEPSRPMPWEISLLEHLSMKPGWLSVLSLILLALTDFMSYFLQICVVFRIVRHTNVCFHDQMPALKIFRSRQFQQCCLQRFALKILYPQSSSFFVFWTLVGKQVFCSGWTKLHATIKVVSICFLTVYVLLIFG